jgi:hypothetical protein
MTKDIKTETASILRKFANSRSQVGLPKKKRAPSSKKKAASVFEPVPQLALDSSPALPVEDEREGLFLKYLFTGDCDINNAMKLAGYTEMGDRNRYYIAQKIFEKHESQAGDHRKLMRRLGLGEIMVILKVLELLESDSDTVRVRAVELAGKWLGMSKEGAEAARKGIQIIIKGDGQAIQVNSGAPPRPQEAPTKILPSPKPITIIK